MGQISGLKMRIALAAVFALVGCQAGQLGTDETSEGNVMTDAGTEPIVEVIRQYEQAANTRDVSAFRRVLALDDPRFTEIEDHIPRPFDAKVARDILKWIEQHPDSGYRVKYESIRAFMLADGVGYAIATNTFESPNGKGEGRVTFVVVRGEDGTWRILHGHWSDMPKG
jgi:ketosteroid isomerase-like protein